MPVKFAFKIPQLAAWMLLHQTYNSISRCEDSVFGEIHMTAQQHGILMAVKHLSYPATPTQIADWVDRNLNTTTMIIERMEKKGLVKRVRDIQDRRSYRVAMTEKGEEYCNNGTARSARCPGQENTGLPDARRIGNLRAFIRKGKAASY